jgi:hypothetical protein
VLAFVPLTTQIFLLKAAQGIIVVPLYVYLFLINNGENSKKQTLSNVHMETGFYTAGKLTWQMDFNS